MRKLKKFKLRHIPRYMFNAARKIRKIFRCYVQETVHKVRKIHQEHKQIDVYQRLYKQILPLPPKYALNRQRRKQRIVVSFTSYPARFDAIPFVIKSLAYQSMKADKIVLYLSKEQCDGVPPVLNELRKYGLEIKMVSGNMRSHKKYLYALAEYPDDIVITIDDDLVYPRNMIKALYLSYKKFPECVSALMVNEIGRMPDGSLDKYVNWKRVLDRKYHPSNMLMAMTGAGALYPPHLLCAMTFDTDKIKALCFTADDIWMKFMELKSGVKVVHAINQKTESDTLNYIANFYEGGLYIENCTGGKNDKYVQNMTNFTGINLCNVQ